MFKKILLVTLLVTPLATFAQSQSALEHANGNASFNRVTHAPEIDGGNAIMGLVLLGGIVSLIVRRKRKNKKED
jgi:LPXTG-motif cell wall-anchored protein